MRITRPDEPLVEFEPARAARLDAFTESRFNPVIHRSTLLLDGHALAAAAGLLPVTPEYDNSVPGVFKNAIDWLTRPASNIPRVFLNRAVALIGATPGRGGTLLARAAWLPMLRILSTKPWSGPRVTVRGASRVFGESGQPFDQQLRTQLQTFMAGFAEFIHG